MSKFKVGDKVKVLYADIDTHLIGKICEVTKVDNYKVQVQGSKGCWNADTNGLELVEEPKIKFKVGDVLKDNKESFKITILKIDSMDVISTPGGLIGCCNWTMDYLQDNFTLVRQGCPFKRGDKVKHKETGVITTVTFVPGMPEYDRKRFAGATKGFQTEDYGWRYFSDFELITEEECEPCVGSKVLTGVDDTEDFEITAEDCDTSSMVCGSTLIIKKETFMSKATNYIKNLTLSADEKLLRKYGFKDGCGDYTGEAIDLVKMKLVKDNEVYLIEIAKGLELEAKEDK